MYCSNNLTWMWGDKTVSSHPCSQKNWVKAEAEAEEHS